MEKKTDALREGGFKLNVKRTLLISLAFFGILALWQVYNTYCAPLLTHLFAEAMGASELDVQYLVGIMMAIDNVAAFIMLPIFGRLSDKTKTRWGKRMPYIIVGTLVSAIAFPFIPLAAHYNSLAGVLILMFIVIVFMMMYRNPAVSLMPDVTPKPLRGRANGIINMIGFVGGALMMLIAMILPYTNYAKGGYTNIWIIEAPFLIASVLMVVTALIVFFTIDENKLAKEMEPEMERGELYSETVDSVEDHGPMTKENKRNLLLILGAEVLWFMGFNALETFVQNYGIYYLHLDSANVSMATMVLSIASFLTFMVGGLVAEKIGRKWTIVIGLALIAVAILGVCFIQPGQVDPETGYAPFPWVFILIFIVAGVGWAFINTCSFPMVVELCGKSDVGKFTGYYYSASMLAQSITAIGVGALLTLAQAWVALPIYSTVAMVLSLVVFLFVKSPKGIKHEEKPVVDEALESLGNEPEQVE